MQRQLAATEAEFRCALQENARETGDLRHDLEVRSAGSAAASAGLRLDTMRRG